MKNKLVVRGLDDHLHSPAKSFHVVKESQLMHKFAGNISEVCHKQNRTSSWSNKDIPYLKEDRGTRIFSGTIITM